MIRSEAYINAGKKRVKANSRYDITMNELLRLREIAKYDFWKAITDAYFLGVEAGARVTERRSS